ncbi:flavin-containing monooxygenase [Streptomyces polygonati]|uniref:Flavin-containing monooxygenase n=1 Tax=Streptomyces polygonati TaxID=1617087 RepID=A0ABV8HNJ8_9ACTN
MTEPADRTSAASGPTASSPGHPHVDVLIVGAGLSGIGAACHLRREAPGSSYAIVEARGASGGTWDLFRYPGVRSDSDMYTLGYSFRPWRHPESIADGDQILRYVRETAAAYGVDDHITYNSRVLRADWSGQDARWTVTAEDTRSGERTTRTCGFLYICSGYYRYDQPYTPAWQGRSDFAGTVVHPQAWPPELDVGGKRVVVIGSGATAVTLVPALAAAGARVTMLQRSPSFVMALPTRDVVATALHRVLPARRAYAVVRWKNVRLASALYRLCRKYPARMRALFRKGAVRLLPDGYDVDTHFNPAYDPWDQRLCVVPDGDFFAAIRSGAADVVTDRIEAFTATGLRLRSGGRLDADVIVTATGLNLLPLGGIELSLDGQLTELPEHVAFKAMMLDGIPNLAFALGYTNASWTLKADLVSSYVARLLASMRRRGHTVVTPRLPAEPMDTGPYVDMSSGYLQRSLATLPLQGDREPWRLRQHYVKDARLFQDPLADEELEFRA